MAKVTIMGDIVQIKTELTKKEVERVKAFAPNALKLYDEDENEVFSIGIGDASYSKYGICFCSEDSEGKLFMSTDNPVTNHSDPDYERLEVTKYFAQIVNNLTLIEAHVSKARAVLEQIEASVADSIVFA